MTESINPNRVIWIEDQHRRPLCDIPWLGTSVVLSDGSVNFCCFSSAVVGNVNERPFEQIWGGREMRAIRQSLSQQRLPPQCQTSSCPIYRGDDLHYIFGRMEGPSSYKATGTYDPHAWAREQLQGSELRVSRGQAQTDDILEVNLEFHCRGEAMTADLFVAVRHPDGVIRFLPELEEYAVPFRSYVELSEDCSPLRLNLLQEWIGCFQVAGEYQICTALFECDSNPNLLSNCYWSESKAIILNSHAS